MSTSTMERPAGYPTSLPPARPVRTPPPPAAPRIPIPVLAGLTTLCTTLCLGNLFDGLQWWLLPSAGAIVLAGVVGECGRRIRTPLFVMPLLYVVAGWLYVIPVSTHGSSFSSNISLAPSPTTWSALRSLAQSGSNDIHSLTVPVPERPGFLFLTVAGVYLVAALVDAIAAGLKRPAAAGLPLLALLAVPAAVVERGVGLLAFAAACLSYLALLLESGRRSMTDWARLPPGSAPEIRRMTGSIGRRIGAVALVAALVVPVIIPRYSGIAHDHRGGGGGGSGSATVIEPFVTLAQQVHSKAVEPLLTVHTRTPEYLRLTALEHFDGRGFTLGSLSATANERVSRGLPAAAGGTAERVKETIAVKPVLKQRYLPVPYQPTSVKVLGDWRLAAHNFTIFSAQTDTSGLTYTVSSQVPTPSPQELQSQSAGAQLPTAIQPSLQLPGNLPTDIKKLSDQLTNGYSTEYDQAAAIQAYLRGPLFTYDLNGAPSGPNALEDFLFSDRRGYCEQFAAAMVVLAREVGIPARVAVGFTPGTQQRDGSWLVTNHDAHSWPEIWFPQAGWVRFEPTKRDTSTDPPSYTLPPAASPSSPAPSASASTAPSATASAAPSKPSARQSAEAAAATAAGGRGDSAGGVIGWSAGALALVALLLTPFTVRRRRRRLRLTVSSGGSGTWGPAGAAGTSAQRWLEIVDTATDLGLDVPATLTPRRTVEHWARLPVGAGRLPDASYTVLIEAAQAEELARYAGTNVGSSGKTAPPGSGRLQTALTDWEHSYGGWVRLRAVFAPRSVINPPAGRNGDLFARWPRGRSGRTDQAPIDQT